MKRWRILCTGNQIAGREMSQKRKKLTQSAVVVPESSGNVFGIVSRSFGPQRQQTHLCAAAVRESLTQLFQMDRIIK